VLCNIRQKIRASPLLREMRLRVENQLPVNLEEGEGVRVCCVCVVCVLCVLCVCVVCVCVVCVCCVCVLCVCVCVVCVCVVCVCVDVCICMMVVGVCGMCEGGQKVISILQLLFSFQDIINVCIQCISHPPTTLAVQKSWEGFLHCV